jgi:hypothetical protein
MSYRIEQHNLDGRGYRQTRVFDLPARDAHDYWASVTDIPCPCCAGTVRWAEAGYVPGYRICDGCGRRFLARGTTSQPRLLLVGGRHA